jgi:hypothetical protein
MAKPPTIREVGYVKELYGPDRDAEHAKREHKALVAQLQAEQVEVPAEIKPGDVTLGGMPEAVLRRGGPFHELVIPIPRGRDEIERPAANPGPGNPFVPARYRRTKERTKDFLAIFAYVPAAA